MAKSTRLELLLPFFTTLLLFAAYVVQGSRTQVAELPHNQRVNDFSTSQGEKPNQDIEKQGKDELCKETDDWIHSTNMHLQRMQRVQVQVQS
ncbi:uncharacterized protein LOC126621625 isoform X2 [Malus sylvestris]|uniref:uncharacterized protein LOC126621625 isoform X2 n=1 Tax=Malus sylvestris TaxID=3752 RepID=UPI0021AC9C1C|nr:uncharacterized protein LOC126621625 isoform X2 [Malus sylvestris]